MKLKMRVQHVTIDLTGLEIIPDDGVYEIINIKFILREYCLGEFILN